jgi:hypothetical protein
MDSNVVRSLNLTILIWPDSADTASENVRTIFASTATPVANAAGEDESRVGTPACTIPVVATVTSADMAMARAADLARFFMDAPL